MTKKVAYLGIPGAFSEEAARQYFGNAVEDIAARSFTDIFEAVHNGDNETFGILPVENSLAGTVAQSYELLTHYDGLQISGEIILHIEHALMALPGVGLNNIKTVRSHPQALAQCAKFLQKHKWELKDWYNTAGSAKDLAEEGLTDTAAIASPTVAGIYGLDILARGIQDIANNYTRFFVVSKQAGKIAKNSKTSLIFKTRHEPGSLVACLQCLSDQGLNLTKIESRPIRDTPWEYFFYVDVEGYISEPHVKEALASLLQSASMVRVLGSYPAAEINTHRES